MPRACVKLSQSLLTIDCSARSLDRGRCASDTHTETRMKLFAWRTMALAVIALATACHNGGHNANTSQGRLLNAVGDAEPLNLLIDGGVKASAVALGQASSYA